MPPVTHQTVKLSKGRHSSPEAGACVMELASMLASEPFSDHPASVCPVIASFLRAYNDAIDDDHRQDLYPYAAKVVGSRTDVGIERQRAARVAEWLWELKGRRRFSLQIRRHPGCLRPSMIQAAEVAARSLRRLGESVHVETLELIDELLEMDGRWRPDSEAERVLRFRQTIKPMAEVR